MSLFCFQYFSDPRRPPRRTTALLGLVLALILETGCSTVRPTLWPQFERVTAKRPQKNHEPLADRDSGEPVDEPSMAANVAIKDESDHDSDVGRTVLYGHRPKPKAARPRVRMNGPAARLSEISPGGDTLPNETNPNPLIDQDHQDSSMDRLNAALSDDAAQVQELPEHSLTTLEARIRVDLLISRAKRLLDLHQLEDAYRNATLAQELGESAQLDFSPDEDRPIDLVRRIEGQLEAQHLSDLPARDEKPMEESGQEMSRDAVDDSTEPLQSSAPHGSDKSPMARIRRDWSTLFRRNKKTVITDTDAVVYETGTGRATLNEPSAVETSLRAPKTGLAPRDGVVVANRSVAIGSLESLETSGVSFSREAEEDVPRDMDQARSGRSETARFDADRSDDHEALDSIGTGLETGSTRTDVDDLSIPQTDLEMSEPLRRTREIQPRKEETPQLAFDDDEDDERKTDWRMLYLIIGVCSVLAIACYRRGAT